MADSVENLDRSAPFVHPSAAIESGVSIGSGTRIWSSVQVRTGARIGRDCNIGRNVFIDLGVVIGDCVKVQNNSSLYEGVVIEDGAFIGPHVIFTNDRIPRSITPGGRPKDTDDWELGSTTVCTGASLGAGTVVVTGTTIGAWAMVGSGTVVTRDIPAHALVVGNPGRVIGWITAGGQRCETQAEVQTRTADEIAMEDDIERSQP